MRWLTVASLIVLVGCLLQACQSGDLGKPNDVAQTRVTEPNRVIPLREEARAYATRLNQGRCEAPQERASFEAALHAAERSLSNSAQASDGTQSEEETRRALAKARLEIGDAARNGGCPDIASAQYTTLIRSFPGAAYAQFRHEAEIGLSALQL